MSQILVAQKVTTGVYKGVTTSELDELAAETAASMTANHPDYAVVRSTHAFCRSALCALGARSRQLRRQLRLGAVCAAGSTRGGLQPAQEHAEVIQRDVRARACLRCALLVLLCSFCLLLWPAYERARTCAVCSVKLMAAHVNPKNGEAASLIAEDVAEIVAKVCMLRCVLLLL